MMAAPILTVQRAMLFPNAERFLDLMETPFALAAPVPVVRVPPVPLIKDHRHSVCRHFQSSKLIHPPSLAPHISDHHRLLESFPSFLLQIARITHWKICFVGPWRHCRMLERSISKQSQMMSSRFMSFYNPLAVQLTCISS